MKTLYATPEGLFLGTPDDILRMIDDELIVKRMSNLTGVDFRTSRVYIDALKKFMLVYSDVLTVEKLKAKGRIN